MARYSFYLLSAAASILPVFAQIGTNCNIVSTVIVVSGDTLGAIATANGVTVDQLAYVNSITNVNFIAVGQSISIPNPACQAPALPVTPPVTATCSQTSDPTYTVKSGDTLTIIAETKLGITLAALVASNPQIQNPDAIAVGDKLNVPLCAPPATSQAGGYTMDKAPTYKRSVKNRAVV
ncbi:uncharacterized protein L3040_008675 [Drepanopeziza brunnea f. sp. 'multigermtubi']|uniref:Putative cell wall-associated hydrolase n=1 Tax=Marssonina brunnea f. sp. multigermtubi (strain MB_m1) TaxID=1072389 RepID=K1WKR9_MARBU|nr:putative cell wall-associated hydrolase [Drepanopeziza brunnea f. sp. 'multigermtubi' MB_m1]EKD13461.1 putative cell wall-associated hydrolase [Drepanopeziza brunnea f. sp. 'multigermtubi' MB_m1]KAJ5033563.1 hypothetical protein L3040_008675 [Drepanopeziza brunnea f. sp. 'multigermtubi']